MYAIGVAEYSRRSITDPSDRLPALTGMTSFLERSYEASFFFGGGCLCRSLIWACCGVPPASASAASLRNQAGPGPAGQARSFTMAAESMTNMCECTVSQADVYTAPGGYQLCSNLREEKAPGSAIDNHRSWRRNFDADRLRISYRQVGISTEGVEDPRPFPAVDAGAVAAALETASPTLRILGRTARFRLTDRHPPERQLYTHYKKDCKQGNHLLCHLAVLDGRGRWAGTLQVSGNLVPGLRGRSHKFLALSRSTLYRVDEDPSWDADSRTFREEFDSRVWWPAMNVLLLSEPDRNGVVERIGVGKIHVTAFEAVCEEDEILLG